MKKRVRMLGGTIQIQKKWLPDIITFQNEGKR